MPMVAYMKSYFSASWIPQSKFTGPSPFPMATILVTPASRARAMTCSRSVANCLPSRWAWESTNIGLILFQAGARRNFLQKASQHGFSAFQRGGDDHPIRLQPTQFPRREISDDDDLASDQRFRSIGLCDSSDDLPDFGADIDFKAQQLV